MTYFTRDVNPADPGLACRQKFVILITDGADTYACSGNGIDPGSGDESSNPVMYRRRMLTVQRAKELHDAGMEVFVVGFGGSMPDRLKRTLNWAARYGGTDNPLEANSGDPGAYDFTRYGDACGQRTRMRIRPVIPFPGTPFWQRMPLSSVRRSKRLLNSFRKNPCPLPLRPFRPSG